MKFKEIVISLYLQTTASMLNFYVKCKIELNGRVFHRLSKLNNNTKILGLYWELGWDGRPYVCSWYSHEGHGCGGWLNPHLKVFDHGCGRWLNPDLGFCEMSTPKRKPKVCSAYKMSLVEARDSHNHSWKEVKGRRKSFDGLGGKGRRWRWGPSVDVRIS